MDFKESASVEGIHTVRALGHLQDIDFLTQESAHFLPMLFLKSTIVTNKLHNKDRSSLTWIGIVGPWKIGERC